MNANTVSKRKRTLEQDSSMLPPLLRQRTNSNMSANGQVTHTDHRYDLQQAHTNVQSTQFAIPSRPADVAPRKFNACEGCRKQKIRCDMPNETPPCQRCQRRNLICITNKSIHTAQEDAKILGSLRKDVMNLHRTLDEVCRHLDIEAPKVLTSRHGTSSKDHESDPNSGDDPDCEVSPPLSPSAVQAPIDTFLEAAKLGSPGSADQSLTHQRRLARYDLITKDIISFHVAEKLLNSYFNRLDHYLYGIASMYKDVTAVRQASPILFAAICTVSALHETGPDQSLYESCNREFRRMVSRSLFEKTDIEFIRAMVIASFWLSDASRIFSANGIRRAADARLYRAFRQATSSQQDPTLASSLSMEQAVDRTRLWYLLFISDQHMAIMHKRDSLLRADRPITNNWEMFLDRPGAVDNDVRVLSQVSLLLIMGQARDTLDLTPDDRLSVSMVGQLNNFSRQLDKWYNKFVLLFKPNPAIEGFPAKGLQLHYHFGKLHLGHHVFQGLKGESLANAFIPAALMAHHAAISIFEMIYTDTELQQDLIGMPHYFHIMIAFAGHFVLEVCNKYSEQLTLDLNSNLSLIRNVLVLFERLLCIPQHPIRRMTPGLIHKLFDCATKMNVMLNQPTELEERRPVYPQNMQFPQTFQTYQYPMGHQNTTEDFLMANVGEFQFPEMSLNFMSNPYPSAVIESSNSAGNGEIE